MTVGELRKLLATYPDDLNVMTKKTEIFGNVGYVHDVREDSYGFLGIDVPCVLLTDRYPAESEEEK